MQTTTKIKLPEGELTSYLDSEMEFYGKLYRITYRIIISEDYKKNFRNKGELRNYLVSEFDITSRLAYSIVSEIEGRLKALREENRSLLRMLGKELFRIEKEIDRLERNVSNLKEKARKNELSEKQLKNLRWKKHKLYWLRNKQNKKRQKIEWIRAHLKSGKPFRIGFGSKKRFKAQYHLRENGYRNHQEWYDDYVFFRDHNISSLGSAAETSGNLCSTLFWNKENGTYNLRLRKFDSRLKGKERYLWVHNLRIPYLEDKIREIVKKKVLKPLYHRFVRSPKGYYLHISFDLDCPEIKESGYSNFCGIDYNHQFMELAVSDSKGNLIYQEHIELLFHGTGKRAQTEMDQKASKIAKFCRKNDSELILEDLDFKDTKALLEKAKSKRGKNYNRIVHTLDYRRYKEALERACRKEGVKITFIPPYYTSVNGIKKFGESRKLNRHQAAAYYISRNRFEAA